MFKYKKILFITVVFLQLTSLGFMIGKRLHILNTGQKVILECQPIDPRSLFSGDYVILNYKISALDKKLNFDQETNYKTNDTIYVALYRHEKTNIYKAKAFSKNINELKKEFHTIIKGIITYAGYNQIEVRYGVETYYVPQYEGTRIENNMTKVTVEISISESGDNAISRLFIEGKEIKFN